MTFSCTTVSNIILFPSTISENYDTYQTMTASGYGYTPDEAYKNSIAEMSKIYDEDLVKFVRSKNYPDLQVESSIYSTIVEIDDVFPITPPIKPSNIFYVFNAIKDTVVARYSNQVTAQNTATAEYYSNCLFGAYYDASDCADQFINTSDISSVYLSSCITSTFFPNK